MLAQVHAFTPERIDPTSGIRVGVGTPDSVQVLTALPGGARGVYQLSGVTPYGQEAKIELYGSKGYLCYDLLAERITGATAPEPVLGEVMILPHEAGGWRVEAEFIEAIREGKPVRFTDFASGVAYMEFTEAVARSAAAGVAVTLPLTSH